MSAPGVERFILPVTRKSCRKEEDLQPVVHWPFLPFLSSALTAPKRPCQHLQSLYRVVQENLAGPLLLVAPYRIYPALKFQKIPFCDSHSSGGGNSVGIQRASRTLHCGHVSLRSLLALRPASAALEAIVHFRSRTLLTINRSPPWASPTPPSTSRHAAAVAAAATAATTAAAAAAHFEGKLG